MQYCGLTLTLLMLPAPAAAAAAAPAAAAAVAPLLGGCGLAVPHAMLVGTLLHP